MQWRRDHAKHDMKRGRYLCWPLFEVRASGVSVQQELGMGDRLSRALSD